MKLTLFIVLFAYMLINSPLIAQKKDTIYYDAAWEKTTKKNATFYRPMPLLVVNELKLIRDYYKNGNLQMQGYVMRKDEKKYVGMTFWYNEDGSDNESIQHSVLFGKAKLSFFYANGKILMTTQYKNGRRNGENIVFDTNGSILYKGIYIDGFSVDGTFNAYQNWNFYSNNADVEEQTDTDGETTGVAMGIVDAVPVFPSAYKGKIVTEKLFWYDANSFKNKVLAEENVIYFDGNLKTYISRKNYSKEGKLLQSLGKEDFNYNNQMKNGIEYSYKTSLGFAIADISNKVLTQETRTVNLEKAHSLIVNEYNIFFFQKKDNLFTELDYSIKAGNNHSDEYSNEDAQNNSRENNAAFIIRENDKKGEPDFKKYISADNSGDRKIINTDEIRASSVQDLLNDIATKEWTANLKKEKDEEFKEKRIIKMLNNQVFMVQTFYFRDAFNYNSDEKDAKEKKWRLSDVRFYNYFVLNFGKDKHIIALFNRNQLESVIIPLKNGYFINSQSKFVESKNNTDWTKNIKEIEEIAMRFEVKDFYKISKNTQRTSIDDVFGNEVIDGKYDSVRFNRDFFITETRNQNSSEIAIYNILLEKLPLKGVKAAYFNGDNLVILQDNEIKYIDAKGQTPQKKNRNFGVCGTVSHYYYSLDSLSKSSKKQNEFNQLRYSVDGPGARFKYSNTLVFNNLNADFGVTFLDKSRQFEYDDNSGMFGEISVSPTQLLVSKKVAGKLKYGIYMCDEGEIRGEQILLDEKDQYKSYEELQKMEKYKKLLNQRLNTVAVEKLPIIYDDILYKNGVVILQKDNKFGIFPFQKELKYKSLGELKSNFIRFEMLNRQKGWLDLNAQKEFLDN